MKNGNSLNFLDLLLPKSKSEMDFEAALFAVGCPT